MLRSGGEHRCPRLRSLLRGGPDRDEAVDLALASVELDERTIGVVVRLLQECVESGTDPGVDLGRGSDEGGPEVVAAGDHRLLQVQEWSLSRSSFEVAMRQMFCRLRTNPNMRRPRRESSDASNLGQARCTCGRSSGTSMERTDRSARVTRTMAPCSVMARSLGR